MNELQTNLGRLRSSLAGIRNGYPFMDSAFYPLLITVYTASFVLIFLIPADFWDDLQLRNDPDIISVYNAVGLPPFGWLVQLIECSQYRNFLARIIAFCSFFGISLLVRHFLVLLNLADERERNAISLLTATLPLFQSRFMVTLSTYSLSLASFSVGMLLLARSMPTGKFPVRLCAYLLFLFSFFTQSFLVLYGFLLMLIILADVRGDNRKVGRAIIYLETVIRFVRRAPGAFILPFLFFFLKSWWLPPRPPMANYNSITLAGTQHAIMTLPTQTIDALLAINGDGTLWWALGSCWLGLCILCIGLHLREGPRRPGQAESQSRPSYGTALAIAFLGLMFSVFPYAVVGKYPNFSDFDDRLQLTMVITAGPVIVFLSLFAVRSSLRWPLILGILGWAVAHNVSTYLSIIVDGHTQNAVVREFALNETIKQNSAFLVDTSRWPNVSRGRTMGAAQLTCLMKDAFGDESRFADGLTAIPFDWDQAVQVLRPFRNFGTCFRAFPGGKPLLIEVLPGMRQLSVRQSVFLSMLRLFAADHYLEQIHDLARILVLPVPAGLLISHEDSGLENSDR